MIVGFAIIMTALTGLNLFGIYHALTGILDAWDEGDWFWAAAFALPFAAHVFGFVSLMLPMMLGLVLHGDPNFYPHLLLETVK